MADGRRRPVPTAVDADRGADAVKLSLRGLARRLVQR